jgi:hypothetical protein
MQTLPPSAIVIKTCSRRKVQGLHHVHVTVCYTELHACLSTADIVRRPNSRQARAQYLASVHSNLIMHKHAVKMSKDKQKNSTFAQAIALDERLLLPVAPVVHDVAVERNVLPMPVSQPHYGHHRHIQQQALACHANELLRCLESLTASCRARQLDRELAAVQT